MSAQLKTIRPRLPRTVWALGLVSFFMDISSEMIHALLPLFLTVTLGANVALVGIIDGAADATAAVAKVFSGYISDRLGKRKPLILIGYGLAVLSKPFFAVASGPGPVFAARIADRLGKGVRGAPRDALIADVTSPEDRGRAYGLRQALDTAGAFIGPLLAILLMAFLHDDMRRVFWIAVIPAVIAVLLVAFGVEERAASEETRSASRPPLRLSELRGIGGAYWTVILIGGAFSLARFSESFLILKASDAGLPIALAPFALVVMNVVYSLAAYPAGAWSDRTPPHVVLLWGLGALVAADLVLALATGLAGVFLGIVLWGGHMALTQGVLARMVADSAPVAMRSTAFGLFNLISGAALFAASVIAGLLWESYGPSATFFAGGAFAVLVGVLIAAQRLRRE